MAGPALLLLVLGLVPAKMHAYDCTVTSMADSGAGTLRQCIADTASGGTIGFSAGGSITLTSGKLAFGSKALTIQGLTSGSGPSLRNMVTIDGNASSSIFAITDSSGSLTIANLNLTNGKDTEGAISINRGHLTATSCTFSKNVSTSSSTGGAAIYNYMGSATVSNSTFVANSAMKDGGAINNDDGVLTVTNSTFSGNKAGSSGGAIYSNSGSLTVTNSTLVGNVATTSGAISAGSTTVGESNNIFYGNSGGGNADFSLSISDIAGSDPKLTPLGWYGGPTQTMLPLPGSPAICSVSGSLTTDQRGFSGDPTCTPGLVDAGAIQTNQYKVTSLADTSYGSCTASGCSLRDAINAANSSSGGDIVFSSSLSGVITLSSSLPSITGAANVLGPGLSRLTISGNNSSTVGSLFVVSGSGASLLLYGLIATEGKSTYSAPLSGGAVSNNGGFVTVLNSALTANSATYYGGGIYNSGSGSVVVQESTLSSNTAASGGGALYSDSGTLTVINSTISSNSTSYSAGSNGGAIDVTGGDALVVAGSTFQGNYAGGGGAILTTIGATILNSTFAGNYVPPSNGWGGAIYDGGGLKVFNSTFANNSGWYGGGIYSDGHATTILNSIFYNNTASATGGGVYNGNAFVADGFNLFYGNIGGDSNVTLSSNDLTGATADPKLSVLGSYGGPTQTMVPLTGSAALNAGQYQAGGPVTDQRGAARPSTNGAPIDIGAVQLSGNPPLITSISPVIGSTVGGTTVTISGVGMDAASGVHFGGVPATSFNIEAATSTAPSYLTAVSPASSAGIVDVTVTNPSGTSSASTVDRFTYVAPPAITSISPSTGKTSGNTSVTITGTDFSGATSVNFGASAAISYTVDSATQITALSPAQPSGSLYVTVTTPYGISSTGSTSKFTYVPPPSVISLSSTFGATTGGNTVVITGTNFLGTTAVKFGSSDATTFTVNSDTQITATSPAQSAGAVDITVITTYGTSSINTGDRFTYYVPVATTITASSGTPQSTRVTSLFATDLMVIVRDNYGFPLGGITVTFSAPSSGASATFSASSCITAISGAALGSCSVSANANATVGTYSVTAGASGVSTTAFFSLTNTSMPTFTVTTLVDDVSGVAANCNDTSDGSTPFPNCSLRDAIAAVSTVAQSTASTITLDLLPTINFSSSLLTAGRLVPYPLGSGGTLEISGNVNIDGPGAEKLAIDGSGSYPIFYFHQSSAAAVNISISGLTMKNGVGNTNCGAAITSKTGVLLTVTDSEFVNNSESAIYNESGEVRIVNDLFAGNAGHGGGAIRNAGNLTVTNSTFSGNSSVSLGGGAISTDSASLLKIFNSTISGNFASSGGGIWAAPGATLHLANSIVSGNWVGTINSASSYNDLIDATGETTFIGGTRDLGGNVVGFYNIESATPTSPAIALAPLGNYGGHLQTLIPLPGSIAICSGLANNLPTGVITDQRGTGMNLGRYCPSGLIDAGAVQTNYAIAFTTQPSAISSEPVIAPGEKFTAVLTLKESGNLFAPPVTIPLQLTTGKGTLSGGSATTSNGVASYSALQVSEAGTDDVITAKLTLNEFTSPALVLTAQSNSFDVAKLAATIHISNLSQTYTGLPISAGITTVPSGLRTSITYNGSTTPPTNAGTYAVVASIDDPFYQGTTSATLVIGKAASGLTLKTSTTTALLENPVTLTATMSSSAGAPTGGITFFSGGVALNNPISLDSNGVATLTTSSLPVGTDSLTAVYSGNSNYNSSASNAITESVVDFNFSMNGSVTTAIVRPGETAQFQFTLSTSDPSIPFPSDVALTVAGLPAGATYTITPQVVTAGSGPTAATLTIKTTTPSNTRANYGEQTFRHAAPLALALMLLPWAHQWRKRGKRLVRLLGILALTADGSLSAIGISGCCGGGFFGGYQKTYTIVVTGTSGNLTRTSKFTLTIE